MSKKQLQINEADAEQLRQVVQRRRRELEIRGGGPQGLQDSLREVIARRRIGRVLVAQELSQLWLKCVESSVGDRTRVVSLRNGILLIEVSDSVLRSELASFQARSIQKKLVSLRPDLEIKSLKFRLNSRLKSRSS